MKAKKLTLFAALFTLLLASCGNPGISSSLTTSEEDTTSETTSEVETSVESSTTSEESSSEESSTTSEDSSSEESSSSSSSSELVDYTVTINHSHVLDVTLLKGLDELNPTTDDENLTVFEVEEGSEVTLQLIFEENYRLSSFTVDGENASYDEENGYTFTVNDNSVVNVGTELYKFSIKSLWTSTSMLYGADVSLLVDTTPVVLNETKIAQGDDVTVRIENETYYLSMLAEGIYVHVNDDVYHASSYDGEANYLDVVFPMPNTDVDIWVSANNCYSLNQSETSTGFTVSIDAPEQIKVVGWAEGDKYDGGYWTAQMIRQPGFAITSMQRRNAGEENWTDMSLPTFNNDVASLTLSPFNANTEIKIEGEQKTLRNINYVNKEAVSVSEYTPLVESAIPGEMFQISGITALGNNHITSIDVDGVDNPYINYNFSSVSFTMPDNDVTITFNVMQNGTVEVSDVDGISSYIIKQSLYSSEEATAFVPGSYYYIIFTLEDGYVLSSGTLTNKDTGATISSLNPSQDYSSGNYYYNFQMPSDGSSVVVNPVCGVTHAIDVEYNQEHINSVSGNNPTVAGGNVNIYVNLKSNLIEITNAYIKDHTDVSVNLSGNYITFTMPDYEVTLVIETKEKQSISVLFTSDEHITSFSFYQSASATQANVSTPSHSQSYNFLEGPLSISNVQFADGYIPQVVVSDNGVDTTIDGQFIPYNGTYQFNNVNVASTTTKISLVGVKNTVQKISIVDETGDDVTYTLTHNGETVDAFQNVYLNDTIDLTVTSTPADGYAYVVTFTVGEEELEAQNGSYYVSGNVTITISKVQAYTYRIVNNIGDNVNVSVSVMNNATYAYLSDGDLIYPGDSFNITSVYINNLTGGFHLTVTNGDEIVIDEDCSFNYYYPYESFEVKGNVTVTVSPLE